MSKIKVRASSWGGLFDCAMRWEGQHLLGMRMPVGIRAVLGTALHASTATYDRAYIDHEPMRIDDAASVLAARIHTPEYETDYRHDDITPQQAESIGLRLHHMYCEQITPTMHYVDVETTLKPFDIDCGGGLTVTLTGTMDRARVSAPPHVAHPIIPDLKSGRAVISKGDAKIKGRSAQLGTYELLYSHTRGVETGGSQVIALSATSKPAVAVSPVFDARRVMVGTEHEKGLIEHAAEMFRSGLFPPNPSSIMCSPRYCPRWGTCPFHE
ncbi:hypothetical protein BZM27_12540 [Paraburkholderia steynii]|uniref:PD-(D/E)XK endonuclease-like domain-containing protein n=1 Tax=Paraburkholderia steynii TaxID=1245441 RepID=A0A4R0XLN8_9BURK|nr:hypothetical protein BZM27_12540 [Paraburkholderia steynii]